jgi:hypothetical protein
MCADVKRDARQWCCGAATHVTLVSLCHSVLQGPSPSPRPSGSFFPTERAAGAATEPRQRSRIPTRVRSRSQGPVVSFALPPDNEGEEGEEGEDVAGYGRYVYSDDDDDDDLLLPSPVRGASCRSCTLTRCPQSACRLFAALGAVQASL